MESVGDVMDFIRYAEQLYNRKQGIVLARILSLSDSHVSSAKVWANNGGAYFTRYCVPPFDEILAYHLVCVKALHMQNFIEAFNYQRAIVIVVVQIMEQEVGTNWMLPVMSTVCLDLRLVAQKADIVSNCRGIILENAAACLIACFRVCALDDNPSDEDSKRVGLLTPVNHLLRMYFRLDKYNLCQPMIRAVELTVAGGSFSLAQQVTFKFYVGRLALIQGDYRKAEKNLSYAFRKCYAASAKNKQMILTYLLPVKLLLGFMPTKFLTDKYNLPILWNLATAIKNGDIKNLILILKGNRALFGSSCMFSAVENLKMIAYRNVFKMVYKAQGSQYIPISCFQAGLQLMSGENVSASKTLSIVGRMIYTKKMRAYLSYQQQMVIFSSESAFPRLSTIQFPSK